MWSLRRRNDVALGLFSRPNILRRRLYVGRPGGIANTGGRRWDVQCQRTVIAQAIQP
jgi:hypothetical protein